MTVDAGATSGSPGWAKSDDFCRFRAISRCLRPPYLSATRPSTLAKNETRVLQRLTSATERTKKCVTTRTRPAVAGTASAAQPTLAAEPCAQVINAQSYDGRGGGAAFADRHPIVCARASPPEHPSHTLTPSLHVRRRNDGIGTAAAALVVGRAPAEPASGYGSSAPCDRIDRRALAVSRASCRCRALMACEHAAACYAASWVFVRCSGADVVLSHRPQSTVPVPSAPVVGMGPLVSCRVRVGKCYAT